MVVQAERLDLGGRVGFGILDLEAETSHRGSGWDRDRRSPFVEDYPTEGDGDLAGVEPVIQSQPARIDVDGWLEEARQNEVKYAYIVEKLGFNPNSPKQVKEQFVGADLRDTKATTLENLINSPFTEKKWGMLAEKVLDARRARKLHSCLLYTSPSPRDRS